MNKSENLYDIIIRIKREADIINFLHSETQKSYKQSNIVSKGARKIGKVKFKDDRRKEVIKTQKKMIAIKNVLINKMAQLFKKTKKIQPVQQASG